VISGTRRRHLIAGISPLCSAWRWMCICAAMERAAAC
jgi:hypothetical protein